MAGVSVPGVPADLAAIIRQLEHRIENLETASRLYSSSIREGTLRIEDSNGNPMVILGKLDDGTYGIHVQNPNGRTLFRIDSAQGQSAPLQIPPPILTSSGLVSGAVYALRPGTALSSFVPLWNFEFWSVGNKIDYNIQAYANANTMEWRVTLHEQSVAAVVVVGPNAESSNVNRLGTITIPSSCLASGTDPAGRHMYMSFEARRTSGADPATADIAMIQPPRNYS